MNTFVWVPILENCRLGNPPWAFDYEPKQEDVAHIIMDRILAANEMLPLDKKLEVPSFDMVSKSIRIKQYRIFSKKT